ncbi:polysaccharide biosynthesis protein CapD [Cloacibacterium rupense]|uniref:Polysaccharide biosynthesis protein CapD n=1 Tax=Cloacibacterium rupense TaxID=517423 RepID=A0ABQ2NLP2_9FLAO|nr:nucleoside-diphosphate sugar epimerase/dehydratase [Cloacibacterium rupense]GGP06554.1 polysaccharide biosynthesis protein CapD [Cloacibacterium rupense]
MFRVNREMITSGDNYLKISSLRYLPRWMVLLMDVSILFISLSISYYILSNITTLPSVLPVVAMYAIVIGITVTFMLIFNTYSGIIRHSSFVDLQKIFWSLFLAIVVILGGKYAILLTTKIKIFYTPLILLYFVISFTLLLVFRITVKQSFLFLKKLKKSQEKKRLLVLGISNHSVAIAGAILDNDNLPYEMNGFLTKRNDSKYARLLGKRIITREMVLKKTKEQLAIDGVLLLRELLDKDELDEWVTLLLEKDIEIFQAPIVEEFSNNRIEANIRNLQIEDLLERTPIKIQNGEIMKRHFEKAILVTGGAGSIGSEIVRQVAQFKPSLIVVLDQAETPLYEIEIELREKFPDVNFKFILADISNNLRLEPIFEKYNFSMVYHAAAYKHVPMIEHNPHEAVLVNVLGSKNLALLASKYKVSRFVMISTDKAVNPTNVMGASKRVAELFVQSLQDIEGNTTKFITTRFGNVLGSNGSVIPHFKRQIQNGGPVTITHPDIVRYFMTIPEACELVLQAGSMGQGGEIYMFDMGKPIKILDLAQKMIKLSGLEIDKDIKITFTGLRHGEKLYEELLTDGSKTLPTPNEKIMVSKDPTMEFNEINTLIKKVIKAALRRDKIEVVIFMKKIVPEFKSNNSIFEKLDK